MGGGRIVSSLPSSYDPVFGFHAEEVWDSCGLYLIGAVGACEASVRSRCWCGRAWGWVGRAGAVRAAVRLWAISVAVGELEAVRHTIAILSPASIAALQSAIGARQSITLRWRDIEIFTDLLCQFISNFGVTWHR